jgi:hypothetical protein
VVTLDGDSSMAPNALSEIDRLIRCGRYVGGGTRFIPERNSAGISATLAAARLTTFLGPRAESRLGDPRASQRLNGFGTQDCEQHTRASEGADTHAHTEQPH